MTGHLENDKEIINGFKIGDQQAFEEIFNAFNQELFFFAKRFVDREDEAEDVAIGAFAKLWENKGQFEDLGAVKVFLLKTARNKCLDILRHEQVKSKKQETLLQILENDEKPDALSEIIRLELLGLIYQEIEKLPGKMKQVFLMAYRDGMKTSEIAAQLDISAQTVSNQKVTAMNLLKNALRENHFTINLLIILESHIRHLN